MPPLRFRLYCAVSADGFLSRRDGGVDWLDPFGGEDHGMEAFLLGVAVLVMGRRTYDQVRGFGVPWPYAGRRVLVLTRRPLDAGAPPGVEPCSGSIEDLRSRLAATPEGGDVWVVGGAEVHRAFLAADAIDAIDLFVVPVLLGEGVPLFAAGSPVTRPLRRVAVEPLADGIVHLRYERPA